MIILEGSIRYKNFNLNNDMLRFACYKGHIDITWRVDLEKQEGMWDIV